MRKIMIACVVFLVSAASNYSQPNSFHKNYFGEKQSVSAIPVWSIPTVIGTDFSVGRILDGTRIPLILNSAESIAGAETLEFSLPSGIKLIAIRRDELSGDSSWQGDLYNADLQGINKDRVLRGNVIFSFNRNYVSGVIYDSEAVYEILPVGREHYLVKYISGKDEKCRVAVDDITGEPVDGHFLESPLKVADGSNPAKPANSVSINELPVSSRTDEVLSSTQDSGDRVDIMVVYTGAVAASFGGSAQTDAFVQTAVASTNTVFANSWNRVRINTVYSAQIDYNESGNSTSDLNWLKSSFQVNQLRNANSADLVVMLTNTGDACGISQLLTGAGVTSGSGFSVVKRSCAVGGTAFAHEIGHLFGADHDPADSPIPPAMHVLPFAYGKAVNGQFVTLMGFFSNSICPDYCPRLLMFSNPSILYNGTPTGIMGQRDNARVIEYTADMVANLRTSSQTITIYSPNSNATWRRNMPRDVRWDSSGIIGNIDIQFSRDGGLTFQTIISDTPNDGVETVALMGMTTRRARIRVVSTDNRKVTDTSLNNFSLL